MNASQLTTIWLYLLNAHNYLQAALLTAKPHSDSDVHSRLATFTNAPRLKSPTSRSCASASGNTPPAN